MATRKLVLGSAAHVFVATAILAAAVPALAQQSSIDPAQTYAGAKAQYEAELQNYNQKQQAYERQRSEYDAKVDRYQRALNNPAPSPDSVVVVDDPDPDVVIVDRDRDDAIIVGTVPPGGSVVVTTPEADDVIVAREADDFAQRLLFADVPPLVRVEDFVDVNNRLFNAPVVDAAGLPVGHFRRVEIKDTWGGIPAAVITLDSRRTIAMATEHVRIDPDRGILIADLTARQIDTIPSGFPYG
jgi:hypothetical protein